ncbi:MAG: hypothetical protein E7463_09575 [Ruminococcaceae bacterium]|nr:hypothetical protein [Oscillospiraceae bacterium]
MEVNMFGLDFFANREFLNHEFTNPHFDASTGLSPDELAAGLRQLYDQKLESTPYALLRAEMFAYLYDHVQLEINPLNLFAAKINHQKLLQKYTGLHKAHILSKFAPEGLALQKNAVEWGCRPCIDYHHTLPNWNDIQSLGFPGLLHRAEMRKAELLRDPSATQEQLDFIESVIIVYSAIMRLLCRIRDASLNYPQAQMFSECMTELIAHAPQTIYQAMMMTDLFMMIYEVGLENARTFGLIDRLYEPLYLADLEAGRFTDEEVRELFRYFINKYSAADRWAGQPFGLGGADKNGNYGSSRLTRLILEIYSELNITNPKVHVRYHKSMPEDLLRQVLGMIRSGTSSINLQSDEAVWKAYEKIGIGREISQHYVPQGCYEPTLMGLEEPLICCSWISIPKAVEFAVNNGVDMLTGKAGGTLYCTEPAAYKDFYRRFLVQLDTIVNNVIRAVDLESQYMHLINPSPLYSGTFASCIEKSRDIYNQGAVYSNTSLKLCGIGTAVDSLLIIKKYVYDEKKLTLQEFREILQNNWQGYEDLRIEILNEKNRYANGLTEPDTLARDIYAHLGALIVGRKNQIGGVYRLGADSVMHCIDHAVHVAATPDGRLAGAMFSKNMCGVAGKERQGVTAAMRSVLSIDTSDLVNAAVFDFILHPSAVEGERGMAAFVSLARTYFECGGMVLQGNVFGIEDLYAAQQNPEKYSTLQVRVCGWNEYFVKMTKEKQDDFIRRCRSAQ